MAKKNKTKREPDTNQIAARVFEKIAGMPVAKGLFERTKRELEQEDGITAGSRAKTRSRSKLGKRR